MNPFASRQQIDYPQELEDVLVYCYKTTFQKGDFTIARFRLLEEYVDSDGKVLPSGTTFGVKGNYYIYDNQKFRLSATLGEIHPEYGANYIDPNISSGYDITNNSSKEEIVSYLSTIMSYNLANLFYELYPSAEQILNILESRDRDSIMKLNGVGESNCESIFDRHISSVDYSYAIGKLKSAYGMTVDMVKKIVKYFGDDPAIAVVKFEENPYLITSMKNVGFKKADQYFLVKNPDKKNDIRRVSAYLDYMFEQEFQQGNTWLTPEQFVENCKDFFDNDGLTVARNLIKESDKFKILKFEGNDVRITTERNAMLEARVANMLNEILKSMPSKPIRQEIVEDGIQFTEELYSKEMGIEFKYDESQRQAIYDMCDNQIFLLQGLAGSGKSTTVRAVVNIFMRSGLNIGTCALSGKASKNLTDITGFEGQTIHRLVGYGGKNFGEILEYDAIFLDEISMVDITTFEMLLSVMKKGCKLIMIGDLGQLPSIGVGVANGIIHSNIIPTTTLQKIHRQALSSAIIRHSIDIRKGSKPKEIEEIENKPLTYGDSQDLTYVFVDKDKEYKIVSYTMQAYNKMLRSMKYQDILVLTQTKKLAQQLNVAIQTLVNHKNQDRIHSDKHEHDFIVGDRVMCINNRYDVPSENNVKTAVFNGSMGELVEIVRGTTDKDSIMIVDFENIGRVKYKFDEFQEDIQLGYACTVHKSQGSTLKGVVVALPMQYMLNSRELLYTAMTRAKQECIIVTSMRTMKMAIRKEQGDSRQTNLELFLKAL